MSSSGGPSKGLCPDWVLSSGSNVHVARDREWFVEYHPWKTTVAGRLGDAMDVIGIGVVEVPVKRSPRRSGPTAHGKLRLHNVLHAPSGICNILGSPATGDYAGFKFGASEDGSQGAIVDANDRQIAYLVNPQYSGLLVLRLSGPPVGPVVGPSRFEKGAMYMIGVTWTDAERQKWRAHQKDQSGRQQQSGGESQPARQVAHMGGVRVVARPGSSSRQGFTRATSPEPYTTHEKGWLKQHYGGEFKFLQVHGLSIYKDEDREEGRRIVRAILAQDRDEDEDDDDDGEDEDEPSEKEWNPEGHFADHHFSESELEFIEGGWGSSANFMSSFDLKFYNDEDCSEAKAIVRGLMRRDD
ncbi:hypothetical protein QBC42DRAFT_274406 [Cladorrhinum samala]|uniref:Retrovirus-related Pol polyprotein from transposon TNT 1-94-like beta-barrel domain-containing protein n=1 Tax=Cladorrhinum samala TaxID=585594 RepID=A0AAV9HG49_9PEZI|nr:hypothetical protein QBC42DRAFT_274406 [Cladorrhinum samala]